MNNPEMSLQELEQDIINLTSDSENIYSRKTERIKRDFTENFLKTLFAVGEQIERARISSYISPEELDALSVQLDAISLQVTEKLISEHYVNFDDKFLPYFIEKRNYHLVDTMGDNLRSYIYARPSEDGVFAVSHHKGLKIIVEELQPNAGGFGQSTELYIDKFSMFSNKIRCLQPLGNNEYLLAGPESANMIKFNLRSLDSWTKIAPDINFKFGSQISVAQPMEDGSMLVGCENGELYECDWNNHTKPELICKSANRISGIELTGDSVFISEGYNERGGQPPFLLKKLHRSAGKWETEIVGKRHDTCFRKIQSISEDKVQALRWGGVDEYSLNQNGKWDCVDVLSSPGGNFIDVQFLPNGKFLWIMENAKTKKFACGFHSKKPKGSFFSAVEFDDPGRVIPLRDGKLIVITNGEMRLYDGEIANAKQ